MIFGTVRATTTENRLLSNDKKKDSKTVSQVFVLTPFVQIWNFPLLNVNRGYKNTAIILLPMQHRFFEGLNLFRNKN